MGDETTLQVLREKNKSAASKSYMWLYRTSGDAEYPIVLYEYQPNRKAEHAERFLKGFSGWLHADGYQGYHKLPSQIRVVGCWAHARRKFGEALNTVPKEQRQTSKPAEALCYFAKLFHMEREFEELPAEERYALRLLFREPESNYACSLDDFYCSLDRSYAADTIEIDALLTGLTEDEKITFLSWCNADFNAHLHLRITENLTKPGAMKRKYWGGESTASIFEEDTFDMVECIYLPPLRDAEAKLSAGRRSRLAWLLKKKYGDNTGSLVDSIAEFNNNIVQNKDDKYTEIQDVKTSINGKIVEALGEKLGQSINLQFSETTFNRIIENIRMVFFPHTGETDIAKFRDLATNSLGYNNLLYIATVFAELELIKDSDIFTILLIEEPEAHLHPQLQVKFIKYLEALVSTLPNAQVIVSTHSPVLASSVKIDKLIHLVGKEKQIVSTMIGQKKFADTNAEKYINRWLDVTKSTMLFSRGIILVEGIAEALVLPKLAEIVLKKYNQGQEKPLRLASTLDEMGVSVINVNGINFQYFMKLFGNFQGSSGPDIPIFCSGLTDRDPGKDDSDNVIYPEKDTEVESKNPVVSIKDEIDSNTWTRLFVSPLKTFEYDLATYNPKLLATA